MKISVSALAAAELPDTITESKLLTPICTKRFATAKMAFCRPEGMPIISTRLAAALSMHSFFRCTLQASFWLIRCRMISRADSHWAMALAMATPRAAMWHWITKNRFRATFTTPAMLRYSRGRFVSPAALRTPLPKLYTAMAGIPRA